MMQQGTSFSRNPALTNLLDRLRGPAGNLLTQTGLKKPVVLALDRLGLGANMKSGDIALDAKRFMQRSSEQLQRKVSDAAGKRVLMTGPIGTGDQQLIVSGVLGLALRLRGADARILLCDSALKACELVHAPMFADADSFLRSAVLPRCPACQDAAEGVSQGFQLPILRLSTYLREAEYHRSLEGIQDLTLPEMVSYEYQGLGLGEHVRTSLHRFFLVGSLVDDDTTRAVGKRYLASAIQLANGLHRLFDEWQPDVVVTYHGIYLLGGVCLEATRSHGIRAVSWDLVYRRHCVQMSHGDTYHHEFRLEPWDAWENLELSPAQSERLDTYLALRRGGTLVQDAVSYHEGAVTDCNRIAQELRFDPTRRKVVLFTNVAWDGRVHADSNLYQGPTEWIIDTMRHLADRQDAQVVVRIHPAEVKETAWKGLQRVDEEIYRAFPVLPQNVVLIPPESKVSSYALAEMADVVLVYSTLMGLEVLLMGKPVVITGDAYYSNKGFGIQPASREEYLALLDNLAEIGPLDQQTLERLRRYAYHFFFRRWLQLPLPYYGGAGVPVSRTLADLLPGKANDLDRVCEGIIHGTPFHVAAE